MKTKILNTSSFVFAILFSLNAAAAPTADWAALSTSSSITTQTLDPQVTSGGAISDLVSGDFNCDGYDDLAATTGGESRSRYGKVYIHLGSASYSFPADLTDADYEIAGTTSGQYFGLSPVKISTVDSDACPELVLNAKITSAGAAYDTLFLFNSDTISSWASGGSYTIADADSSISMGVSNTYNYNYVHNVGAINGAADGEYLAVGSSSTMLTYFVPVSALVAGSSIGTIEDNSYYSIGSDVAYKSIGSGDFNDDGVSDLLIGYSGSDPDTLPTGEDSFVVVFGPLSDSPTTFNSGYYDLSITPSDDNVVKVMGDGGDIGSSLQAIDIDADGKDEILASDTAYDSNKGVYYLISGLDNLIGVTNLVYADTSTGSYNFGSSEIDVTNYVGDTAGGYVGGANNAAVADIDGDGYDDAFLGGQNSVATKGSGFLLFNNAAAAVAGADTSFAEDFGTEITLSSTSRADVYIEGELTGDYLATKVIAGDFDADGSAELVTYASGANSSYGQIAVFDFPIDMDADGVSVSDGDCADLNADFYPGATELGDTFDNDCDGGFDEGLLSVTVTSSLPASSLAGDTFTLDVEINNQTGFSEFDVLALLPEEPLSSMGGGGWFVRGFNLAAVFCNTEATNCAELASSSVTIPAGTTQSVSLSATLPDLEEGAHTLRVRVNNPQTEAMQGYLQNWPRHPDGLVINITK